MSKLFLAAAFAASAGSVFATDLIFTNAEGNGQWEEQSVNWIDAETEEPSAYIGGANAYFLEGFWGEGDLQVYLKKLKTKTDGSGSIETFQFNLGDTIISNDTARVDISADSNSFYGYHTGPGDHGVSGGMYKYGTGLLDIHYHNQFNGDFICHGGTVATHAGSGHPGDYRSALGSNIRARKVVFEPNTRLEIYSSWPFGGPTAGGSVSYYFTNATVKVEVGTGGAVAFGRTVFNNTVFEPIQASRVYFANDVTFTGRGEPVTFDHDNDGCYLTFGKNCAFSDLHVDDITGDDRSDVIFNCRFDTPSYLWSGQNKYFPKNFRKTGAGTIELTNKDSINTGVVEVAEGKAVFSTATEWNGYNSVLGAIDRADGSHATVIASHGATVELSKSCLAGCFNNPMSWEMIVSNATLRLGDKTYQHFGGLHLHNATLDWQNAYQNTWIDYDFIGCSTYLALSGDTPYDFQPKGQHPGNAWSDNCTFRLGFTLRSPRDDHPIPEAKDDPASKYYKFTNMWNVVDFIVEDITKDDGIDATMGWTIKDMVNYSYLTIDSGETWSANPWKRYRFHGGIRKTGAGTFRTQGKNSYTHTTEVAEGALIVDGTIASSSAATVDAGGYLGGTGTVCAVTVKAGGGFIVDTGKAFDAVLKVPTLTTEGAVKVRVSDMGNLGCDGFRQQLLQLADKPESLDLSQWKVEFQKTGRSRGIRVGYDAATGIVSLWRENGMLFLIK